MSEIMFDHVSKVLRGKSLLTDVSFSVNIGQTVGFSGPNGSGKTLLLKTVLGFVRPNSGTVTVSGKRIRQDVMFASNVGFSFGTESLVLSLSAKKNLSLITSVNTQTGKSRIATVINAVGLDYQDHRRVKDYSLGMKQRLSIACALIDDYPIIILDEPTNGLDKNGIVFLQDTIRSLQNSHKTILLTSHDESFLHEMCDNIYFVNEGRVTNDDAEEN